MSARTSCRYSCEMLGNAALKSSITATGALDFMECSIIAASISSTLSSICRPGINPLCRGHTHREMIGSHLRLKAEAKILFETSATEMGRVASAA